MPGKKRCKNGLRRDGKTCRKTKCRTYITKKGFCAKAGGWYAGKKRRGSNKRSSTKKRTGSRGPTELQKLRQIAEYQLGYRKAPPLIGDEPRSRRNYGRGDPDQVANYIERLQRASYNARDRSPSPYTAGWGHNLTAEDLGIEGAHGRQYGRTGPGGSGPGVRVNLVPPRQGSLF